MAQMNRRRVLAGLAGLTAAPVFAQTLSWSEIASRARALPQCHAISIHLEGRDVLTEVFRGPKLGRPVPVKSVSKTIVAALTGAALDRRELPSLQATLGELTPQIIPPDADARVSGITVEHLVTMQAGLERTSGANYAGWVASDNWVADALKRPIVAEPGGRMLYSTGSFHVLGAVLSEVSGSTLLELARRRLGEPLGIEIPGWTRDPQGRYLGGNEMALSVPDMVRFGEVFRRKGRWGDRQVLSQDWVERSLVQRTRSPFSGLGYGYGWFLGSSGGNEYALARGYGGQIICIVPDIGLTVVITSDPTRPARSAGYFGDLTRLIEGAILPAALVETT